MKKTMALLLSALLALTLAACGSETNVDEPLITRAAEETTAPAQTLPAQTEAAPAAETQAAAPAAEVGNYTFVTNGVELVPGAAFDPGILPEANSVYQVPSCAIEGTDNLYNYGTFELTAFNDGTGEVIYSILLIDPNITTTEGLALGDSTQRAVELYGEGYTQQGNSWVYTGDAELLVLILQGDTVASIEYRMIVD